QVTIEALKGDIVERMKEAASPHNRRINAKKSPCENEKDCEFLASSCRLEHEVFATKLYVQSLEGELKKEKEQVVAEKKEKEITLCGMKKQSETIDELRILIEKMKKENGIGEIINEIDGFKQRALIAEENLDVIRHQVAWWEKEYKILSERNSELERQMQTKSAPPSVVKIGSEKETDETHLLEMIKLRTECEVLTMKLADTSNNDEMEKKCKEAKESAERIYDDLSNAWEKLDKARKEKVD
ncbi:hypothetical protein PFISCL1PPCAC_6659, partial [Pristionchus fissidentatus]